MSQKSKLLLKEFLDTDSQNPDTSRNDAAFEAVQKHETIQQLRSEATTHYNRLIPYLDCNGKEILYGFDEVYETMIFISSYIS